MASKADSAHTHTVSQVIGAQATATLDADVAALAGNTSSTLGSRLQTTYGFALNVTCPQWGVKGDGTTDDTAAIQAVLDHAGPKGLRVFFPKPTAHYKITAALQLKFWQGLTISGDGWETTEIRQYANNEPIFSFTRDNTHSFTIERLRLTYQTVQNYTSHPRSAAIARLNTDGLNSLSGIYHHAYRDLKIIGATFGFKVIRDFAGDTSSTTPWWGCEWNRVFFSNIARSCVDLNLGAVGAPCNVFRQCKVFMNGTYPNDGAGAAFALRGEAIIEGMDVENWRNQVLYVPSASYITIRGLHIEHQYVLNGTGGNRLIYLANTTAQIEGLVVHYDSIDNYAKYAVYADVNTSITVNGASLATPTGGANYLLGGPGTSSANITVRGINPAGLPGRVGLWTNGSGLLASIVEVEDQPPILQSSDTLPTPSATYRGRRYTQLGNGTTTADQQVVCLMSSTGTYSWVPLVSG